MYLSRVAWIAEVGQEEHWHGRGGHGQALVLAVAALGHQGLGEVHVHEALVGLRRWNVCYRMRSVRVNGIACMTLEPSKNNCVTTLQSRQCETYIDFRIIRYQ